MTLSHLGKKKRKVADIPPGKLIWNQHIFKTETIKKRACLVVWDLGSFKSEV